MPTFQMEPRRVADRTEPSHVLECQETAFVAYGKGNRISGSRCRRNFRSQARRLETPSGHSITDYCQSERSHKHPGVSQPKDLLSVYHGSQKIDQVGSSTEGPLSPSVSSGLIERSPVRSGRDQDQHRAVHQEASRQCSGFLAHLATRRPGWGGQCAGSADAIRSRPHRAPSLHPPLSRPQDT